MDVIEIRDCPSGDMRKNIAYHRNNIELISIKSSPNGILFFDAMDKCGVTLIKFPLDGKSEVIIK